MEGTAGHSDGTVTFRSDSDREVPSAYAYRPADGANTAADTLVTLRTSVVSAHTPSTPSQVTFCRHLVALAGRHTVPFAFSAMLSHCSVAGVYGDGSDVFISRWQPSSGAQHTADPATDDVPATQSTQSDEPGALTYRPAGHALQLPAPGAGA